ncbi:MAG: recombinase RecA, partial [Anaerolineales bacterium]
VALKYYSSVRLDIRRIESIKVGKEIIGNRARVRVVKNKVAPPFRVAEFDIMYNEGISRLGDLIEMGVEFEILDKRGSYYAYGDDTLAQGRENTKEYLRENPELAAELEAKIRDAAELHPMPSSEEDDEPVMEDDYDVDEEAVEEA